MTMGLVLRKGENKPSVPASHYSSCTSYLVLALALQTIRKETNDGCGKVAKLHCSNLLSPLGKDSANLAIVSDDFF